MKKKKKGNINIDLIREKKIPILTLDNRWHSLFDKQKKTFLVKQLEKQVNGLLKKQGKLVNEIKNLKKIKKNLMSEIVTNIPESGKDATDNRTMERNKKLIEDINNKIDNYSEQLAEVPYEIKVENEKLMIESIELCYNLISMYKSDIDSIGLWIDEIREKLKENIIKKQILEEQSTQIYSYMHDILGPDVIEVFDTSFDWIPKEGKE